VFVVAAFRRTSFHPTLILRAGQSKRKNFIRRTSLKSPSVAEEALLANHEIKQLKFCKKFSRLLRREWKQK
jgi:hypothetical protein